MEEIKLGTERDTGSALTRYVECWSFERLQWKRN
jgi:hypothetical protein